MKKRTVKKDSGTIFSPVMYLMLLFLTVLLLFLFVEYRQVSWLSGRVTDSMTDALLGAAALNEEELYRYGRTDEPEILYPEEKYVVFTEILQEELGLDGNMCVTEGSIPLIRGEVQIKDFVIYSTHKEDMTIYDFDEEGLYTTDLLESGRGSLTERNGMVIDETTLAAEIGFTINFAGVPIEVTKYHMVDVIQN